MFHEGEPAEHFLLYAEYAVRYYVDLMIAIRSLVQLFICDGGKTWVASMSKLTLAHWVVVIISSL